jgi:hypothetical protein
MAASMYFPASIGGPFAVQGSYGYSPAMWYAGGLSGAVQASVPFGGGGGFGGYGIPGPYTGAYNDVTQWNPSGNNQYSGFRGAGFSGGDVVTMQPGGYTNGFPSGPGVEYHTNMPTIDALPSPGGRYNTNMPTIDALPPGVAQGYAGAGAAEGMPANPKGQYNTNMPTINALPPGVTSNYPGGSATGGMPANPRGRFNTNMPTIDALPSGVTSNYAGGGAVDGMPSNPRGRFNTNMPTIDSLPPGVTQNYPGAGGGATAGMPSNPRGRFNTNMPTIDALPPSGGPYSPVFRGNIFAPIGLSGGMANNPPAFGWGGAGGGMYGGNPPAFGWGGRQPRRPVTPGAPRGQRPPTRMPMRAV